MSVVDYANLADVRQALGVGDEQLPDEVLGLEVVETVLLIDLEKLSPTIASYYLSVKGIATPGMGVALFCARFRAYCAYSIAEAQLGPLMMAAPQVVQSDKDAAHRNQEAYAHLEQLLPGVLVSLREALRVAYLAAVPGVSINAEPSVELTSFVTVPRKYDPVTGAS